VAMEFKCECGAGLSAEESRAGQLVHCEACGLDVPVPAAKSAEGPPGGAAAPAAGEGALAAPAAPAGGEGLPGAARGREDLGALRKELAPEGDVEAAAARRREGLDAFQEQLGKKAGAADMMEQMRAARGPAGAGGGAAGALAGAGLAAKPKPKRAPGLPPPPKGMARAAHHIGFKRWMWRPTLGVGVFCVVAAAYCFVGRSDDTRYPKRPFAEDWQVVPDGRGFFWAIPPGAKLEPSKTGRMFYLNEAGYEEPATDATDYMKELQKAEAYSEGKQSGYAGFGIGFALVGVVLLALGGWMWSDVRLVGSGPIPVAEEIKPGAGPEESAVEAEAKAEAPMLPALIPHADGEPRAEAPAATAGSAPAATSAAAETARPGAADAPAAPEKPDSPAAPDTPDRSGAPEKPA